MVLGTRQPMMGSCMICLIKTIYLGFDTTPPYAFIGFQYPPLFTKTTPIHPSSTLQFHIRGNNFPIPFPHSFILPKTFHFQPIHNPQDKNAPFFSKICKPLIQTQPHPHTSPFNPKTQPPTHTYIHLHTHTHVSNI